MEKMVANLLEQRRYRDLKEILTSMEPIDVADSLKDVDYKELIAIYRLLPKDEAAETFSHMNSTMKKMLINAFTDREIREVINDMFLDDTVDMLEELPANVVDRILTVTDTKTRSEINQLLNYPEDSAGSIMTVEYIGLKKDMTVKMAIKKIRRIGLQSETIYTSYVTENRKLVGYVDIKDLLTSSDTKKIEEIMNQNVLCVNTHDDQEDVVKKINKYGLMAVPVVDETMCIVGIVTVDDALLVQQEENTEDISRMAAVLPSDETYFGTSVFQHIKNRSAWLLILMLSSTITGLVIEHYEAWIAGMTILVSCIPMIMGTGGNSGAQSAALMIRGIAVDEIHFSDILHVLGKEICIATIVGSVLGVANGLRVWLMYGDAKVACVIGITLVLTIVLAKIVGCILPLLAKRVNLDPALMAAPLITTIVDTSSIFVYFLVISQIYNL